MSRLDERIEQTLLQRVTAIIKLWCAEFEKADNGDDSGVSRRENAALRDGTIKRRGDKKFVLFKDDKVCYIVRSSHSS